MSSKAQAKAINLLKSLGLPAHPINQPLTINAHPSTAPESAAKSAKNAKIKAKRTEKKRLARERGRACEKPRSAAEIAAQERGIAKAKEKARVRKEAARSEKEEEEVRMKRDEEFREAVAGVQRKIAAEKMSKDEVRMMEGFEGFDIGYEELGLEE